MQHRRILPLALVLSTATLAFAAIRPLSQEMPQPTPEHAQILNGVGVWEGTLTSFMGGGPADPVPAKETVEGIGKFWTQSKFTCNFMGMPYLGTGCVGYDAKNGKYVGTWIDNMSSYLAVMEGEMNEETNTLVMRYDAPDMTGQMAAHRIESVYNENSYVSTFYTGAGEGTKTMVIEMKRKGKGAVEAGSDKK